MEPPQLHYDVAIGDGPEISRVHLRAGAAPAGEPERQPLAAVFVSYRQAERDRIRPLVLRLETETGAAVWWDPCINIGEQWREPVETALSAAHCVVVFWSHASVKSRWVKQEAGDGDRRGILGTGPPRRGPAPARRTRDIQAAKLYLPHVDTE